MISEEKADNYTTYIIDQIKHIIAEFGDRDPGSEGEFKAHQYLQKELEKYTDEVKIESFKVAPKSFMAFLPLVAMIILVSFILYWIIPYLALILTTLSLLIVLLHFLMYKKILDPFFPKRISHNVIANRKPKMEIKKTLIFSGHVDASYEWRYSKINPKLLRVVLIPAILGLFFKFLLDIFNTLFNSINLDFSGIWGTLGLIQFIFLPFLIALIFFTNFSIVSPGASDNLTGTICALAIAKYLSEAKIEFQNTEIKYIMTGSEEAGLRGAKAYVKAYKKELTDHETVFLGLESFCEFDSLAANHKDLNGTVKNHPAVCLLLKNASKNVGIDLKYQSVYIGGTDSAVFSLAGIPAASFSAMDPGPPQWYHTRYDNIENLNFNTLKIAFKIALEALNLYEKQGLPSEIQNK